MTITYQTLLSIKNDRIKAGFFSRLFFTWLYKLLSLGYKRSLCDDDLLFLEDENKAQRLVELYNLWNEEIRKAEKNHNKPRLWKTMCKLFSAQDCISVVLLNITDESMTFVLAILIWMLLNHLEDALHIDNIYAASIITGIGVASLFKAFCLHHYCYKAFTMGMRLKIAVIGMVHRKVA